MEKKIKEFWLIYIILFLFSYLTNFVWESFHAVFLYQDHNFIAQKYILMVNYVSIIDGILIVGMYLAVSLLMKQLIWIKNPDKNSIYVFLIIGLIIAAIIEYLAVFVLERWSYNSLMPVIFGIGLSPLVQLSITGMFALLLTKLIFYKNK